MLHSMKLKFIACMHCSVTISGSEANGRDSMNGLVIYCFVWVVLRIDAFKTQINLLYI